MALVIHDLVYRDGAVTGASVVRFKLADTYAEMISGSNFYGDMGFNKADNRYYGYTVNGWIKIFNGGGITENLSIDNAGSTEFKIRNTNGSEYFRITQYSNDVTYLSHNMYYSNGWKLDTAAKYGAMIGINDSGYFEFWRLTPGLGLTRIANIDNNGNIGLTGGIYSYNRGTPDGTWIDVPFSSGNFAAPGAISWALTTVYYSYTLIGKTCNVNLGISNSTLNTNPNSCSQLQIILPSGIVKNSGVASLGVGMMYDGGGWKQASWVINPNTGYIVLGASSWPGFTFFAGGNFYWFGQISFGIQ